MTRLLIGLGFVAGVALAVPAAAEDKKDEKGFVQLFNGKDLTGWKTYTEGNGNWKVVDGAITCTGNASHLFSEKDHYANFIYRVEALVKDKGNSGQYFRTQFGPGFPKGYEAQINSTHRDAIKTGSLYPAFRKLSEEERSKLVVRDQLHKPDEWFTQEVTAKGNHIVIKVNGKTTVDFVDEPATFKKGHFALQHHDPGCVVMFRKIEVKELPADD